MSSILSILLVLTSTAAGQVGAETNPPGETSSSPEYSILYDRLIELENKGDLEGALRVIPQIWATEVPVEAFYATLLAKREELLNQLVREGSFAVGAAEYEFQDLREIYDQRSLAGVDDLAFKVSDVPQLPRERYQFFVVVRGTEPRTGPSNDSLQRVLPDLKTDGALESADPWVVSIALHLAARGESSLAVQDVVKRWQSRPDLWDEVCTQQALLFFAGRESREIQDIRTENTEIREALARLLEVSPDRCEVWPLPTHVHTDREVASDANTLELLAVRLVQVPGTTIRRWAGDPARAATEPVEEIHFSSAEAPFALDPGTWNLKVHRGWYYGESPTFECRPGRFLRVPILLFPKI